MDTLIKYGDGGISAREYLFDVSDQINLSDNFRDLQTSTERVVGANGGFNQYGQGALPGPIGRISYSMWMFFDNPADAIAQRNALGTATGWGLQRLYKLQQNTGNLLFCDAFISNAPHNFDVVDIPHRRQRVNITFHAPYPFWQSFPFDVDLMDTGLEMDDGLLMGGWTTTSYDVATDDEQVIAVGGSARSNPVIRVETGATGEVENLVIERYDPDTLTTLYRFSWDYSVGNYERLIIDCDKQSVIYEEAATGNVSGWPESNRTRGTFLTLDPGDNYIRILGNFTNTVAVTFEYMEMYR
jgi:phage-related protein